MTDFFMRHFIWFYVALMAVSMVLIALVNGV